MDTVSENEKRTLGQKLLEFQRSGLESYGQYLADQLESTAKSESKSAYRNYIEEQLASNQAKIKEIDEKLGII